MSNQSDKENNLSTIPVLALQTPNTNFVKKNTTSTRISPLKRLQQQGKLPLQSKNGNKSNSILISHKGNNTRIKKYGSILGLENPGNFKLPKTKSLILKDNESSESEEEDGLLNRKLKEALSRSQNDEDREGDGSVGLFAKEAFQNHISNDDDSEIDIINGKEKDVELSYIPDHYEVIAADEIEKLKQVNLGTRFKSSASSGLNDNDSTIQFLELEHVSDSDTEENIDPSYNGVNRIGKNSTKSKSIDFDITEEIGTKYAGSGLDDDDIEAMLRDL
ncbi:hypothetical protein KAFR_0B05510 [Kazachstania africana CBS 2517]|uniref:Uncharacterized protein n=1 Tax=Kazachstania africana (strain ATCC 22294 / BCRC 22015 / CBS 2517 / CECT 1963 / NBRC 1671 / NRRL Y-8276) TaxID=1071382 RepID=H2AR46_KAZAF|nr:hypothetical protein KAFR_0B05510 [Kazachstania africana CBS 2517]CCF56846.1 hypothetical protein KAFR_0B05510 [Kazachstania africana CBS 2517]